eukprot:3900279-Amphidinium_carterae.1
MECNSLGHLAWFQAQVFSITSDMGTELGLPECASVNMMSFSVLCGPQLHQLRFNFELEFQLSKSLNHMRANNADQNSEVDVPSISTLLPEWMLKMPVALEGDMGRDDSLLEAPAVPPEPPSHHMAFLPNAFTFPGLMHICHNAEKDTSKHLSQWDWFFERLQVIHRLLAKRPSREAFVEACLHQGPYA